MKNCFSLIFLVLSSGIAIPLQARDQTAPDSVLENRLWEGFTRYQYQRYDSASSYLDRYASLLMGQTRYNEWYFVKLYKILTTEYFSFLVEQRKELTLTTDSVNRWCADNSIGFDYCDQAAWTLKLYRGTLSYRIKDYPKALRHFQQLGRMLRPLAKTDQSASSYLASSYRYLGAIYKANRQYQAAIQYFEQALGVGNGGVSARDSMITYKHLGDIYQAMEEPVVALRYYQRALAFYEAEYLRNPDENRNPLAAACLSIAQLEMKRRAVEKVRPYLRRVLELQPSSDLLHHQALLDLAQVELQTGHLPLAQQYVNETLAWRQSEFPFGAEVAEALQLRSQIALAEGKLDQALADLQAARAQLFREEQASPLAPALLVSILSDLADVRRQEALASPGEALPRAQAREAYDQAIAWFDRLRLQASFDEDLIALTEAGYGLYEQALALEAHLPQDGQTLLRAWELMERSHALSLRRAEARRALFSSLSSEDQAQRQLLAYQRQSRYEAYLRAEAAGQNVAQARQAWFEAQQAYQAWLDQHPIEEPQPQALDQVQGQLPRSSALLSYFTGQQRTYRLALWRDSVALDTLAPMTRWGDQVLALQSHILAPYQGPTAVVQRGTSVAPDDLGHVLHQTLIGDLERHLPEQVIVVPDGKLWHLPFDVLRPSPAAQDYWLRYHGHTLAYSGTWWWGQHHRREASAAQQGMLAMAPTFEVPAQPEGMLASRAFLGPLFQNQAEAQLLAERYGARTYLDSLASLPRFLEEAPRYRIIHLSTHGLASDQDGRFSLLAFAAPGDSLVLARDTFPRVQALFAGEIAGLQLDADLVVLSACETNVGQAQRGEGVQSLSQAFFRAGARSLVATLWQVDDRWTKELMQQFYAGLDRGLSKDQALRKAKLFLLAEGLDPYHWSGVVTMGQTEPIDLQDRNDMPLFLGLIGLAVAMAVFWWWGRKKFNGGNG